MRFYTEEKSEVEVNRDELLSAMYSTAFHSAWDELSDQGREELRTITSAAYGSSTLRAYNKFWHTIRPLNEHAKDVIRRYVAQAHLIEAFEDFGEEAGADD